MKYLTSTPAIAAIILFYVSSTSGMPIYGDTLSTRDMPLLDARSHYPSAARVHLDVHGSPSSDLTKPGKRYELEERGGTVSKLTKPGKRHELEERGGTVSKLTKPGKREVLEERGGTVSKLTKPGKRDELEE